MVDPCYCDKGTPAMKLIEECLELAQAVTKGERFGWDNCHPDSGISNFDQLRNECMDVNRAINVLMDQLTFYNPTLAQKLEEESTD